MAIDSIEIDEIDNQLGTVPPNTGDTIAAVGICSSPTYPVNVAAFFSDPKDARAQLVGGPLCEWVCYELEHTGRPVLTVACLATTDGSVGSLVTTGVAGSSVITLDTAVKPVDDFEIVVTFSTEDGDPVTVGTAGIFYRASLDGGRTPGRLTALGTANNFTIADANVKFNLAAGNIEDGDVVTAIAVAPSADDSSLDDALEALRTTVNKFQLIYVDPILDASSVAVCETKAAAMSGLGREIEIIGSWRWKNAGETEQQYLAAWQAEFGATVARHCCVFADAADTQSPISQRRYKRRSAFAAAAFAVDQKPGKDLASKRIGPLPAAVRILDDKNNPRHHDERTSPGLDAARASTLRTRLGSPGAFIGNARLLTGPGSDFEFLQHGRVMDKAKTIVRRVLEDYSSDDLVVDKVTGFVLEEEAADIDLNVNHALEEELVNELDASDARFTMSRTENILSTKTLRGPLQVKPLAYVKEIKVTAGFFNPALRARTNEEEG